MEIDGQTRLVGVLGWPVEHSLSPRMHQAAFKALELNWAIRRCRSRPIVSRMRFEDSLPWVSSAPT